MAQISTPTVADDFDLDGLTRELAAHADEVDRTRRAPVEGLAALAARGLFGALIPHQSGGLGLSPAELFEVSVAIGAGCGATGLIWGQHLAATAFVSRWGNAATRALLPAAARGERLFGIGVGYTSRPDGPVQARRVDGRVLISGDATWVTGATLLTDALLSAQEPGSGTVLMAVLPRALLAPGDPYPLVAVTSGMNATVSFRDVDVTDTLLATPPQRIETSKVFTQNKAPRDAGFYLGLTRAALALARQAKNPDAAAWDALTRIDEAADAAHAELAAWLVGHAFEEVDHPAFWTRYHRAAQVMWQAAGLGMSAGGSYGLRDGSTHNRLAREAMYYLARIPFRTWAPEAARVMGDG